jgi:bifunctional pyridoxal-dependent enzyme with beta-cystathionase and maltose regulon repressor activities
LEANRDYAVERLQNMPFVRVRKPQATYLLFIDISSTGISSELFVSRLGTEAKLALVPGTARFFGPGAEGYVRMCFATSREILTEGLNRLELFLRSLET